MLRNLAAAAFALCVLFPSVTVAQEAEPDSKMCLTIEMYKARFEQSTFKQFNKEQFDLLVAKFTEAGHPPPPGVKDIYMSVTTDDPNILVLLAFDKDGCFMTHAHLTREQFIKLIGKEPPAA